MTGYGDIDVEEIFNSDDPFADWIKLKEHEDPAPNTLAAFEQTLQENKNGTAVQQFLTDRGTHVLDATVQDFFDYVEHLRASGANDRGIHNKLAETSTVYKELMEMNQTDSNPAGYVLSRIELDTDSPDRDYHTVDEIAGYLESISDPEMQTGALYSLKFGIRRGAVVNTDLWCVHLDHPDYLAYLDDLGVELHEKIQDRPDSIYVYEGFNRGDVIQGEQRTNGDKRDNAAVLPVDAELKQALLQWLTIRPQTSAPHPLFTESQPTGGEFGRMTGSAMYQHLIQKYAKSYGITKENTREDVDLQYFRHFFSTQMSRFRGDHPGSLDDELVKYIRGDKLNDDGDEDVLDAVYRHDAWGVNVREDYLENIYTFGLFD